MSLLFEAVIITSYYATIVGIIVILFKKLFEKGLDANWHYLIWFVLILKLLLPNGPQSTISIFNILPWQNLTQEADYLQSELVTNPNQPIEPVYFDNEEQVTEKNAFSVSHQDMLPYIWAAGTVVLLLWLFFTSFALQRKLRRSANQVDERVQNILSTCKMKLGIDKNIPVLIQDIVSTPSIFGYFRPAILLTKAEIALNDQQIKYILLHELAHYQRKDTFVNYLLLLLQAVHWFNPVMWYCFKQIRSDMEIATDERVLNILDENEHKDYSRVLVAILERFSTVKLAPKLLGMVNDEHEMKHRLRMVNKAQFFRKHRNRVITVGVICLVILSVFLLTNARLKQEVPFKDPELEAVARKIINMPKEVIYESDLNIKTFWGTNGQAINDLSGIEYAKNLESVRLAGNKIVDITPLAALTQLHELDLSGNQIIDISPLSSLVALKRIWFDNNQINDISVLSSFTDLLQLHLSSNKISDITALKDYDRIVRLYLDHNDIVNISALADIDCKIISLKYNRIHDISPLVANEKISAHVQIYLEGNPLNKESIET